MEFLTEEQKRINKIYGELSDLKKGKKLLENAMHKSFYDRERYNCLFQKLKLQIEKINKKQHELKKEKIAIEKSRKNI